MDSNSITEFLNRKATAAWVWLTTSLAYIISIVLPIIGANVEKWLKPLLVRIDAPDFIQSDFTVYGTVFGVCGLLTTSAIKKLITIDKKYNSIEAEKLRSLKREHRTLKTENKRINKDLEQKDTDHNNKIKDTVENCDKKSKEEIKTLKERHQNNMDRTVEDHNRELRQLRERLKLQAVVLDAMTNYKSVEQDFKEYNSSNVNRKLQADD